MQEDIKPTVAKPPADNIPKPQPQSSVQPAPQVAKQPVMDVKKPDTPDPKPQDSKDKKPDQPKKAPSNKSSSNIGVILIACFVCALLVGLAIYIQLQQQR